MYTRGCRDTYLFLYPTPCFFTQQTQFQKPPAHRFNMANNNFKGSIINGPLAESVNDFFSLPLGLLRSMFDNIHKSHHQNSPLHVCICVCERASTAIRTHIHIPINTRSHAGRRHRFTRTSHLPFYYYFYCYYYDLLCGVIILSLGRVRFYC